MAINPAHVRKAYERWRTDPACFCREVFGFEPWCKTDGTGGQLELLNACVQSKFISCRSGHKCGKSTILAALGIWWLVTKPRSRVVATAPSEQQVEGIIWMEVKRLYALAEKRGFPLGGILNDTARGGWTLSDGRDFFGRTATKTENFAGISAPNLLILVDEASGMSETIFEAIFGNAASSATVVLISNPTRTSGTFFDSHNTKRHIWRTVHISSTDNPNFHGGSVPGLATPEFVEWAKEQWGYPSAYFDVRVLGEFPTQGDDAVISLALVTEAQERTGRSKVDPSAPLMLGVDVARFGSDSTVITPVRGLWMYPQSVYTGLDGPAVAGHAWRIARELARYDETPECKIDVIGVGASAYDSLKAKDLIRVRGITSYEKAITHKRYFNKRTELWFLFREWLRQGGCLPTGTAQAERLAAELITPCYVIDSKGRVVVESKDKIKERLGRSPDCADSACLAVYKPGWSSNEQNDSNALRAMLPQRRL